MKIVNLTPGTGSFYCGSCLRDHALVRALRRRGHEVLMAPIYLPLVVESPVTESDAQADMNRGDWGDPPIFFGGVNLYLKQKLAVFRKTPRWLDRWLDAEAILRLVSRRAAATRSRDLAELTLSMLEGEQGRQARELDRLVRWLESTGPVDVVCLSNALLAGLAPAIRCRLHVPVVCTLQGEDAFLDALADPHRDAAWSALADRAHHIDAFIAVSHYHGEKMRDRLGLAPERVAVAYNGIDLDGYSLAAPAPDPDPPTVGYLSRMCPDKGLHTLVEAFVRLKERNRVNGLKMRVAGTVTRADLKFVRSMEERLETAGLGADVEFLPNVDRVAKLAMLRSLSLLSVPAAYGEAFGLYVLEALASGVPVVQPRHGAFAELLAETGGGILVPPEDAAALAETIESVLLDPDRRRAMAEQGRSKVFERFGADRMAGDVERVLHSVVRKT